MDWEYWSREFKKHLPADYVDREIEHYQKMLANRDVWPDVFEGMKAYNYIFSSVLSSLRRRSREMRK